jgi:phi13 family phage major tail protein
MTINAGEYKSTIGVSDLYVAAISADSATAYTAGTPAYFAPVAVVGVAPSVNRETQYADDNPYDTFVSEGETELTLTVTGIPPEMLAAVLGKTFDPTTGRVYDTGATPPDYALGFKSKKSNGSYRYYWYLKGKFSTPSESFETQGDTPAPQTTEIVFTAVSSTYAFDVGATNEEVKRVWGDDDTDAFDATNWFAQVQTPAVASVSALALSSSVPTDGATGVSVSANQTLTFNNMMKDDVTERIVISKADGTQAAATITLDATKKIVTIDPSSSLSASTVYLISYAVEDIYGQTLSGVVNFTTA